MDPLLLLRRAVEAHIEACGSSLIEERNEAAAEVGLMLQEAVRQRLPAAIPADATLDGLKDVSATSDGDRQLRILGAFYLLRANRDAMLPVQAELNVTPGVASTINVGGEASIFDMPTSERQFVRRMTDVGWRHCLRLHLA